MYSVVYLVCTTVRGSIKGTDTSALRTAHAYDLDLSLKHITIYRDGEYCGCWRRRVREEERPVRTGRANKQETSKITFS